MAREFIKKVARRYRPLALKLLALANFARGIPSYARLAFSAGHLRRNNISQRNRRVVFVSERPGQREAKLAFGLKKAGWDVILIHRERPRFADLSNFSALHVYRSPWEGVELAHKAEARLFHVFSPNCDDICVRMVQRKPGTVIVDFYDHFFSSADGIPALEARYAVDIARQRYCIERADAVCCRDLQMQYRRRETRLARGLPVLYFPEYCWDNMQPLEHHKDGGIHIAQIGWMGLETLGVMDVGCFEVLKLFVQAGCHIHIYLHPAFPSIGSAAFQVAFADYLNLSPELVHFHPTLPADALTEQISQHDMGFNIPNATVFDIPWKTHNPRHLRFAGSNRMFDYLDAGLLLLTCPQSVLVRRQFRPTGMLIDGLQLLKSGELEAELIRRRADRTSSARKALSIAENIHRLASFYERIA